MDNSSMSIGQTVKYLYKSGGQDRVIDARIVGFNGSDISIEFRHPDAGYLHRRSLRSPKERARLSLDGAFPGIRRGAPEGNTNAKKDGSGRVSVPLSIGNVRRDWAVRELQKQGVDEPTPQHIVRFVKDFCYRTIDEALARREQTQ